MKAVVISDIHIGSIFCRCEKFFRFIKEIPDDASLILNGDTIDFFPKFSEQHNRMLDFISEESEKREVIWIRGNHDRKYMLEGHEHIIFKPSHDIGRWIHIEHGHNLEDRRLYIHWFIRTCRAMYELHIRSGARSIHVAAYAKHFPRLYKVFRNRVVASAVLYAKAHGFEVVICGHTHYVEDRIIDGIRYINIGSWTEEPIYYVHVNDGDIDLKSIK